MAPARQPGAVRADPGYLDRGMLRVVMLDRTAPRDPGPVMTLAGWSPRKMPLQVPQEPIVTECPDMPGRISRRVIFVADPATVRLCRNSIETAWLARLCRLGGDYGRPLHRRNRLSNDAYGPNPPLSPHRSGGCAGRRATGKPLYHFGRVARSVISTGRRLGGLLWAGSLDHSMHSSASALNGY